jgi:hypothetical protein
MSTADVGFWRDERSCRMGYRAKWRGIEIAVPTAPIEHGPDAESALRAEWQKEAGACERRGYALDMSGEKVYPKGATA